MTDPEFADRTYIEPITSEIVEKSSQRERPDALLPTLGGQTALNLAMDCRARRLEKYSVQMIGAIARSDPQGRRSAAFQGRDASRSD